MHSSWFSSRLTHSSFLLNPILSFLSYILYMIHFWLVFTCKALHTGQKILTIGNFSYKFFTSFSLSLLLPLLIIRFLFISLFFLFFSYSNSSFFLFLSIFLFFLIIISFFFSFSFLYSPSLTPFHPFPQCIILNFYLYCSPFHLQLNPLV